MKNLPSLIAAVAIIIIVSSACHQNNPVGESGKNSKGVDSSVAGKVSTSGGLTLLADTITYDVTVYNINPDDIYTKQFLKNIKPEKLIDAVFEAIYAGKMKAFDIFTNKEMSIEKVKEIENTKGFSRSKVGKIQFTECWQMDPGSLSVQKKVIAMAFGYAHIDNTEGVIAYDKPLFRVYIK